MDTAVLRMAHSAALCFPESWKKKKKKKKNLDQNNRENNSLKAAFLASGTQNELSKKWKMLLNPAVNS